MMAPAGIARADLFGPCFGVLEPLCQRLARRLLGRGEITGGNSVGQRTVRRHNPRPGAVRVGQRQQSLDNARKRLPSRPQPTVMRCRKNSPMEGYVNRRQRLRIAGLGLLVEFTDQPSQSRNVLGGRGLRRQPTGMDLQNLPNIIELTNIRKGHPEDKSSTPRLTPDQTLVRQPNQRLANGHSAHPEPLGQRQLTQMLARLQLATDDRVSQPRRNQLPQISPFNRLRRKLWQQRLPSRPQLGAPTDRPRTPRNATDHSILHVKSASWPDPVQQPRPNPMFCPRAFDLHNSLRYTFTIDASPPMAHDNKAAIGNEPPHNPRGDGAC